MHTHENEQLGAESLRPKSSRVDEHDDGPLLRAAADGRTDVLGPQGLLRLQRVVGNQVVSRMAEEDGAAEGGQSPVLGVVSSGGGQALDAPVREDMESRLGHDFGSVRVHTDDAAHESAQAVNAHAYTVGSNVVFQRGRYDTESTEGRTMLAHELTHVIQQSSGPVDGTPTGDGVRVSDPSDRFEREASANAERAISAPAVQTMPAHDGAGAGGASAPVQREAEEEEPVQGAFVQREAGEEEEPVQGAFVQREAEEEESA